MISYTARFVAALLSCLVASCTYDFDAPFTATVPTDSPGMDGSSAEASTTDGGGGVGETGDGDAGDGDVGVGEAGDGGIEDGDAGDADAGDDDAGEADAGDADGGDADGGDADGGDADGGDGDAGDGGEPTIFSAIPVYGDRLSYDELTPSRWQVVDNGGDREYFLSTTDYTGLNGLLGEYALVKGEVFDDVTVSTRARTPEDLSINAAADICLVLGFIDDQNYYFAMFNSNIEDSAIFRVEGGVRYTLAIAGEAMITNNDEQHFVFSRFGTTLTMLGGGVVVTANDSTFGSGRVGIGSFNDSVYFDDVNFTLTGGAEPVQILRMPALNTVFGESLHEISDEGTAQRFGAFLGPRPVVAAP